MYAVREALPRSWLHEAQQGITLFRLYPRRLFSLSSLRQQALQ